MNMQLFYKYVPEAVPEATQEPGTVLGDGGSCTQYVANALLYVLLIHERIVSTKVVDALASAL